jgi:2,4-dienoyl-CoA reductase-like NADH-dependent reductase (Old Yellow Enzyme family)/thioredoxin reductase
MSARQTNKWKLLEPIKLGHLTLKNRIVMPAMFTRLATPDGVVTQELLDYYSERARGSTAAITVEFADGIKGGRGRVNEIGLDDDRFIPGLKKLAKAIKGNGAVAFIQICHAGRQKLELPEIPLVAPSRLTHIHSESGKTYYRMPRALTIPEIEKIEDDFAESALRAQRAGFDGVELHGSHGYLPGEFVSPYLNRRKDKYGGSLENRASFALEIARKVRIKVGPKFVVGYKMNGHDFTPKGFTPDEAAKFARMLENAGIDCITVSAGMEPRVDHFVQPTYAARGCLVYLAGIVKEAVKIPVITVGSLDVETAEKALREGKADLVALGRALIADPQTVNKLISGQVQDIRPCIRGNEDCMDMLTTIGCEVNPACGKEAMFTITPAKTRKNVVVIGGGIAGMEAARVAALRGHKVTLIEKTDTLGGHLVEASVPDFKDGVKHLVNWAITQVSKGDINTKLNTEATPELVKKLKPDTLVVAVGSDYTSLGIKGGKKSGVVSAAELLLGQKAPGEKIVVLGGGLVGCETALYLAEHLEKQITVVEMLDEILTGVNFTAKLSLEERLKEAGVYVYTGLRAEEISDGFLICKDNQGQSHKFEADTIVSATGLVERHKLADKFKGLAPEVYAIGDCTKASNISHAMESAWEAILKT